MEGKAKGGGGGREEEEEEPREAAKQRRQRRRPLRRPPQRPRSPPLRFRSIAGPGRVDGLCRCSCCGRGSFGARASAAGASVLKEKLSHNVTLELIMTRALLSYPAAFVSLFAAAHGGEGRRGDALARCGDRRRRTGFSRVCEEKLELRFSLLRLKRKKKEKTKTKRFERQ